MKKSKVDPRSPIPLYHQIAESIRARIAAGELAVGDVLEPLREAARTWGVNLHTVRHAYTALAREGLLESRGAGGTRVAAEAPSSTDGARDGFLRNILREAKEVYGMDAATLAREIARLDTNAGDAQPAVFFVECSAGQCQTHVRQIQTEFQVDAREWSLERAQEPPPGLVVATYFHYNDIRRLWPHRLQEVQFVTIVPDRQVLRRIPDKVRRVLVCDRDRATAETVAADFSVILEPEGYDVEPLVSEDPVSHVEGADGDTVVLAAPRVFAALSAEARSHPRVLPADYLIDESELRALGRKEGWRALRSPRTSPN